MGYAVKIIVLALCFGILSVYLACGSKNPFSSAEDNTSPIIFTSFRDGNGEIYLMSSTGMDLINLTNHPGHDTSPGWSPDKQQIVFASTRDSLSGSNLYIMNANGSNVSQLTHLPGQIFGADWSPDGHKIAFSNTFDILTIHADGSNLMYVTKDSLTDDSTPDWSPDGHKIVFTRIFQDGTPRRIIVMNDDGSNQVSVAQIVNGFPRWSPDGEKIVFASFQDASVEIYSMDSDGANLTRLTIMPGIVDLTPDWSPSGLQIVFASTRNGKFEIYKMNANGSGQIRLTNSPEEDVSPRWR